MKLYNPPGFPNEPFIHIPEVGADYDLGALLTGKLHLPLVILNLKEMTVVKNKEGALNVDSLKVSQQAEKPKEKGAEEKPKEKSKEMAMQIDVVQLNVSRVIFKDYSKGEPPAVQVFEVALKDKKFENVTSPQQLVTLIMVQAMGPTAIKSAKVYAAATILGVGFLPAGIVGALVGDDDVTQEFHKKLDQVYKVSLDVIKKAGELKSEDKKKGVIKAKVKGVDVTVEIKETINRTVEVKVSARQLMLPKPEVAGGVLYQIAEELK